MTALDKLCSDYTMGVRISGKRIDANPNMQDSAHMDHWKVTLRRKGKRLTTIFSMGRGHGGAAPTPAAVISCLISDSAAVDQSFDSWCADLGADPDSRRALATFKACQRNGRKLVQFLGDDLQAFIDAAADY